MFSFDFNIKDAKPEEPNCLPDFKGSFSNFPADAEDDRDEFAEVEEDVYDEQETKEPKRIQFTTSADSTPFFQSDTKVADAFFRIDDPEKVKADWLEARTEIRRDVKNILKALTREKKKEAQ